MDFPVDLKAATDWVYSGEEVKQDIIAILSNELGSFIQSPSLGRKFDIHQQDDLSVDEGVRQTIGEMPGVHLKSLDVNLPNITIAVEYNSDTLEIKFNGTV